MKFYLVKILTNTAGQDGTTIEFYNNQKSVVVNYHNTLAAFHNASDVLYAVVEILDEYGRIIKGYTETVDHRTNTEE